MTHISELFSAKNQEYLDIMEIIVTYSGYCYEKILLPILNLFVSKKLNSVIYDLL